MASFIGHDQYECTLNTTISVPVACSMQSIAVDAAGNAWVSGRDTGGDYLTKMSGTGAALLFDRTYPNGSRRDSLALDARGWIHATGSHAGLLTLVDPDHADAPAIHAIANSAGSTAAGRVSPGELISIYGTSLGDAVYIDDVRAPVLYASTRQINTVVPFRLRLSERIAVSVRDSATGIETGKAILAVTDAQPELFKDPAGYAAAINQDGTVNSADNPAKLGTLVSFWGTGASGWPVGTREGALNSLTGPLTILSVEALFSFQPPSPPPLFAGAAPGLLAGVFQINVRLPNDALTPVSAVMVTPAIGLELGEPALVHVAR